MIYLAGPYSHVQVGIRQERFELYTRLAAHLQEAGHMVYSPITLTHPMQLVMEKELGRHDYPWLCYDDLYIPLCTRLFIVQIPGWETSAGVRYEIEKFAARGITPEPYTPEQLLAMAASEKTARLHYAATLEAMIL